MFKRIALFALLALLCLSVASAKTYTFTVSDPTLAGNAQLKPGEYSLKVDGSQVELMDKRIDVTATVEVADQKFDCTAVFSSVTDGTS